MNRHYGMDWLRIGAFGLLIFYHVGMFFVPWDWHVKTAAPADWVAIPMRASNAWRLPLLFVVSGYASAALLARSSGAGGVFLRDRTARLMIPTLFAMVTFIVPQPWVELQFKHGYTASLGYFWFHDYFSFSEIAGIVVPTWQHLWFVVYLWAYTIALVALRWIISPHWREWLVAKAGLVLSGGWVIAAPIILILARLAEFWPGSEETHALLDDGPAHLLYFPMLLFGVLLRQSAPVWAAIRVWWKIAAALALAGYATVTMVELIYPGSLVPPFAWQVAFAAGHTALTWCAIIAAIGVADRYWNVDKPLRATLTEAVFPFYIIHQTIIVVLGWYLLLLHLHPVIEFVLLVLTTVAGCWLFYRIGREIPIFRVLIGLRPKSASADRALPSSNPILP